MLPSIHTLLGASVYRHGNSLGILAALTGESSLGS